MTKGFCECKFVEEILKFRTMPKLKIQEVEINVTKFNNEDYICLTDMMMAKDGEFFVTDWLRNKNTLEYIGIWEKVYNPNFNYGEFAIIKNQAGLNRFKISVKDFVADVLNVALFGKTAKMWKDENPDLEGNIRDYASIEQLIVLINLESMNSELIKTGKSQSERVLYLNKMAIEQLTVLYKYDNKLLNEFNSDK